MLLLIYSIQIISSLENESILPFIPKLPVGFKCPSKSPSLYLPHISLDNYPHIILTTPIFLLYVTATWCDYCCQENNIISHLQSSLSTNNLPIYTLNSDKDITFLINNSIGFFKVPTLYLYHNHKFIQYPSYFNTSTILSFINNIKSPTKELSTQAEIDSFLSSSSYEIKLITFISNQDEYSDELSLINSTIELIKYRPELSFGMVNNQDLIIELKKSKNGLWFDYHSLNSILLKRHDEYHYLDLSLQSQYIQEFLLYNTIPSVEELSNNNNMIVNKLSTPIALFFIDTTYNLDNYHQMLLFLKEMTKVYDKKYVFMYMDGGARSKSKEELGLDKESQVPTLVINYLSSQKKKKFPTGQEFNEKTIKTFLDNNLKINIIERKERNAKIVGNIKQAVQLNLKNYESTVRNTKYDVVSFILDSDYDETSLRISELVNVLIEKFISFGIKSVIIGVYDYSINDQKMPKNIMINHIYLHSAQKNTLHIYHNDNDKLSVYRVMKWIEENVMMKFTLPEYPHIDFKDLDDYYTSRSIIEKSPENKHKNDYEIDDMVNLHSDL